MGLSFGSVSYVLGLDTVVLGDGGVHLVMWAGMCLLVMCQCPKMVTRM